MPVRPRHGEPSGKPTEIEARVRIDRPAAEIFAFYRDFRNLPLFLGDVMSVEPTGDTTSRWTIQGPLRVGIHWTVEVTDEDTNALIRYRTNSPRGLRTVWNISFTADSRSDSTEVREVMELPLGKVGQTGLALIGKPPAAEMAANLHRLKQLMETGRVTDTSHAVPGKFARP
ncbi:SRPBCC family protein [Streptomyces polygonati]|uniref:SRPBCC family protein n=1 Tax=Streptomyces polygonati TaxID=1617087 RepID=A0ABV8HT36_9ACTN